MKIQINKDYMPFLISAGLFLVGIIYVVHFYITWNRVEGVSYAPEVSLPVIEWERYSSLSKQYKGISINYNDKP